MSSMVWLMICFTLSVSSADIPWSPMLNEASLVLPSYLHNRTFQHTLYKYIYVINASYGVYTVCAISRIDSYTPYDRREVGSYLGFDESFVEGRVWSGDHQRGQQAESESFKRVSDAAHRNHNNRSDVLQTNRLKASPAVRCLVVLREDTRYKTVNTTRQASGNKRSNN